VQVETPDNWLRRSNPWEIARPERTFKINFGGRVIRFTDATGRQVCRWIDADEVLAMAYDMPIPGYRNGVVNTLRLWSAKATREFDIHQFNRGDYLKSVEQRSYSENISRVLYPNDATLAGQELRLRQEYFLVSATLQDAVRRHLRSHESLAALPQYAVFQLNDTHPALAVAELMRLLIDENQMGWGKAWSLTRECMNYTNHTILPEALECWPVPLMERLLPRHLEIVYRINHDFLSQVRAQYPEDLDRIRRVSLIEEGDVKKVRMANLAVVGSMRVNGVSALHSQILKEHLFRDFDQQFPGKLTNCTNGVTPRRWLMKCNPMLSALISDTIGNSWETDLEQLQLLALHASDPALQERWRQVKMVNKQRLMESLARRYKITFDPSHLVDTQVKRIHEYKRQLLNILHVVALFLAYRQQLPTRVPGRTFLFGGKAAPGYDMAKRIVHLINAVSKVVNSSRDTQHLLKVHFVPNYGVSIAERIIPASDVSEQISTAGTEASGTGNMKFALNGALTLGTLDGANIEMLEAIGRENMFIFGLTAEEVQQQRARYRPSDLYYADPDLRAALDAIAGGLFSPDDPACFLPIVDHLMEHDPFMVLADFRSYALCQRSIDDVYLDSAEWTRRSILNVARMGRFSSDNTIRTYAREIWNVPV